MFNEKAVGDDELASKHSVRCSDVKVGHLMAFTYYGKITDVLSSTHVKVDSVGAGDKPGSFSVNGKELIESAASADYFQEVRKVNATAIATRLVNSVNRPFTVCFVKADGSERILRGRLVSAEPLMGRSMCEDLDLQGEKDTLRLVDHRTLQWLIVDGIKFIKGKK